MAYGLWLRTINLKDETNSHQAYLMFWQKLIEREVHFITPIKINASIEYQQVFTDSYALRDCAPRTALRAIA